MEDKKNNIESHIGGDSFTEAVEGLVKTIKEVVIKPIKRLSGFLSLGFVLLALLIMSLIFFFMGSLKIIQGLGFSLGVNPAGFAMAMLGLIFLLLSVKNYRKNK